MKLYQWILSWTQGRETGNKIWLEEKSLAQHIFVSLLRLYTITQSRNIPKMIIITHELAFPELWDGGNTLYWRIIIIFIICCVFEGILSKCCGLLLEDQGGWCVVCSIHSLVFKQIIPLIRLNITLGSLSEADQTKTWHFKYYRLWEGECWGNWRQKQTFPCSSFLR